MNSPVSIIIGLLKIEWRKEKWSLGLSRLKSSRFRSRVHVAHNFQQAKADVKGSINYGNLFIIFYYLRVRSSTSRDRARFGPKMVMQQQLPPPKKKTAKKERRRKLHVFLRVSRIENGSDRYCKFQQNLIAAFRLSCSSLLSLFTVLLAVFHSKKI